MSQAWGDQRLLLVGNPEEIHVGAHFMEGAESLGLAVRLEDVRQAHSRSRWLNRVNWRLRGRRPTRLRAFSRQVIAACTEWQPRWLLATGIAPLERPALDEIGRLGIKRLNFLTDDPWNPSHKASWFLEALPCYDHVFSTRRANLDDLGRLGCSSTSFLPFAYAPRLHFPADFSANGHVAEPAPDLFFAGGADADRVPYLAACIRAGFRVQLHGGYWDRFPETRAHAHGHIGPDELRGALCRARVALCLVRRANRDGNVMRTFEVPAIGTCMLTEDTPEHREIFGPDGENVVYFQTIPEMLERLRWLLANDSERSRLGAGAHRLITGGKHTYQDRLQTMLERSV